MSTKRAPKSRSRQTTPQSPPKQSAPIQSSRQSHRSTRSQSREISLSSVQPKPNSKSLAAVTEEPGSDHGLEVVHTENPIDVQSFASFIDDEEASHDDSDETSSNGTTQLETLEADLIVDSLSSLHHTATQILSSFDVQNSSDLVREISTPSSRTSKRLVILIAQFNAVRPVYGNGSYINIPLILRKLTSDTPLNNGPWRPDAILQLANLSLLITDLLQKDARLIYDTLERMFHSFPKPFGYSDTTIGHTTHGTQFLNETVAFGIALRTQFFLKVVDAQRTLAAFDPDSILEKVFFDEDENLNVLQGDGEALPPEAEAAIKQRLESIRKYFKASSVNSINLDKLKRKYSWHTFLEEALRWILLRKQELETQIEAKGGMSRIQARLVHNDLVPYAGHAPGTQATPDITVKEPRRRNEEEAEANPEHASEQPQSSRKTAPRVTAKNVAQLKVLKAQEPEVEESSEEDDDDWTPTPAEATNHPTDSTRRPETVVSEVPQSPDVASRDENSIDNADDNLADGDDDDEVGSEEWPAREASPPRPTANVIVPTQQTLAVLEVAKEQALLGNKENIDTTRRYIDKQANATRIQWDDTRVGSKRSRRDTDDDVDDEGSDFETDARPLKRPRMPRPPPSNIPDDFMGGEGDDHDDDDDDEMNDSAAQQLHDNLPSSPRRPKSPAATQPHPQRSPLVRRPRKQAADRPTSSAPQPRPRAPPQAKRSPSASPPPSSAAEYRAVNAKAKATMRIVSLRPPQVRRPWTTEETERLFEMITVYGCLWARILQEDQDHPDGDELQGRTQVMLKDKARNMKLDFLKAGESLPDGFAAVSIRASDKQMLRSMGLPYQ